MDKPDRIKNVNMRVIYSGRRTKRLVITVDLDKRFGESASGKSVIIGTTGGNVMLPELEGVMVGVNVYEKIR